MQKKTHGPVRLTDSAKGAKARPIGLNEITLSTDGQLGAWQKQNAQDTVPIMLTILNARLYGQTDWGLMQAGVIVTMIPCIVLFLTLQKYYIQGLMAGSVKS